MKIIGRNPFACPWTHDSLGKPLPKWIQDGSVAYAPMISKFLPVLKRQRMMDTFYPSIDSISTESNRDTHSLGSGKL